ncbi:hypothetical protein EIK77_004550 [Talaromyces pinophilus]|nr:hypothetical protein EIK77_004550 [Talaromyces pinophilus]
MNTLLTWLDTTNTPYDIDSGYGLIAAYGLIYLGIALSTGIFWRYQFRWVTKLQGILISAVYSRVLESKDNGGAKDDAIGSMTVDVENFITGMRQIHEIYANVLQIGFATWMIERQIAIGSVAPIVVAILCGLATYKLSKSIAPYQQKLVQSTQKRLNTMTFMLRFLKEMKFSGLERMSFNVMNDLREAEIATGGSYRNLLVSVMGLAYTPTCLSPVLSFAIFVATQRNILDTLDAATLFTAVSLISLITSPLIALFQIIPSIVSAWHSLSRIQSIIQPDYSRQDRKMESNAGPNSPSTDASNSIWSQSAFEIQNAALGYHANAAVLRDISINIPKSSITAITGPVACGKSTVLKTLLGEALPLSGRMSISSDHGGIAYCGQNPWLVSGTIRDNIVGYSASNNPQFDAEWYKTTLWACCLEEDLDDLPDGDSTKVGSNGDSLSGGQKQRIVCVPGSQRTWFVSQGVLIL